MQNTTSLQGFGPLIPLNKVIIDQKINNWEASKNKYSVLDSNGQQIFYLKENTSYLARSFLGTSRNFVFTVYDNCNEPVLTLHRIDICTLQVKYGERLIGTIRADSMFTFNTKLKVYDAADCLIFKMKRNTYFTSTPKFEVLCANNDRPIACIKRERTGFFREVFTHADKFAITFPAELSIDYKILLIGATIFIDFRHFESSL